MGWEVRVESKSGRSALLARIIKCGFYSGRERIRLCVTQSDFGERETERQRERESERERERETRVLVFLLV